MISFIVGTDDSRPAELIRFIRHLTEQTLYDYEVIIADEGKGMNVMTAVRYDCRYYLQPDPRDFHYSAKNMAAKLAKGEYLCFPQDDAEYMPSFVSLMQLAMQGGAPLAVCGWKQMEMGGRLMPPDPHLCRVDVGGFIVRADRFTGFDPGPLADGHFVQQFAAEAAKVPEILYVKH